MTTTTAVLGNLLPLSSLSTLSPDTGGCHLGQAALWIPQTSRACKWQVTNSFTTVRRRISRILTVRKSKLLQFIPTAISISYSPLSVGSIYFRIWLFCMHRFPSRRFHTRTLVQCKGGWGGGGGGFSGNCDRQRECLFPFHDAAKPIACLFHLTSFSMQRESFLTTGLDSDTT